MGVDGVKERIRKKVAVVVVGLFFVENWRDPQVFLDFLPTAPVDGFGLFLSPVWIDANFPHRLLHISTFPGGDPQALGSVFPGKISPGFWGSVVALVDVRADVLNDLVGLWVGLALLFDPLDGVQDGGVVPVVELLADVF